MSSPSLSHSLQRKLQICIWIKNVVPEKVLHSTQDTGLPSPHTQWERPIYSGRVEEGAALCRLHPQQGEVVPLGKRGRRKEWNPSLIPWKPVGLFLNYGCFVGSKNRFGKCLFRKASNGARFFGWICCWVHIFLRHSFNHFKTLR